VAKPSRNKLNQIIPESYVLLSILVPKNNEKTPLAAEQMFAALHGIYKTSAQIQEHFCLEITSKDKFIQFFAWVPAQLKEFVEGQIYSQYPTAEISETEDYTTVSLDGYKLAGTELTLTKSDVFPIKTFLNFEVDPLAGITGVLSQVGADEQIWLQIAVRPVPDNWQDKGLAYASAIRAGKGLNKGFGAMFFSSLVAFLGDLFRAFTSPGPKEIEDKKEIKLPATVEAALTGVEEKTAKLGFESKVRILAIAKHEITARSKLISTVGAFKQFNTTNMNGFNLGDIYNDESFLKLYSQRDFSTSGYIFNIEELASLYHLPNISVVTPSIVWAGSKKGEPPSNLPIEGSIHSGELNIFAKTNFRHITHKFGIKTKDSRLHMYAIGKTGTGKSTMLENMIISDIREGKGVAVVDPHGDLINHILDFVPAERINDVVLFSPSDRDFPIGFNVLEQVQPDLKNIVASGIVGIFKKIFGESWGPRLEYILRNTVLALLDYPGATLLGVMHILVDKDYRQKVVEKLKDPVIRDFFINEYEKYDPKFRTEAIAPIQNKVGQFLSSSTIRNIVGQPRSTINMQDIMDKSKILLLDLSVGKIGEDASALLGAMMITKIQLAAMRRAEIPENERIDFYLYVDEFQNFATDSFATILSEARKYRLSLIMTNQYIAQMPEIVTDAIFGNVGTFVAFRVGATDATFLVKEFEPVFEANDLINLDNYHIYVKMAIDGVTCPAFSASTLGPIKGENANKEKIIRVSREHYGQDRAKVEEDIAAWAQYLVGEKTNKPAIVTNVSEESNKIIQPQTAKIGERRFEKYDSRGTSWYVEIPNEQIAKKETAKNEKSVENKNSPKLSNSSSKSSAKDDANGRDSSYTEIPSNTMVDIKEQK